MRLFDRLLEVFLPASGGWAFLMYEFYIDETGDDGGFPILGVGGYLIRSDYARLMEREWQAV